MPEHSLIIKNEGEKLYSQQQYTTIKNYLSRKNGEPKENKNGDVGLIFHIRDGKVEWIEKINRTTEKPAKNLS